MPIFVSKKGNVIFDVEKRWILLCDDKKKIGGINKITAHWFGEFVIQANFGTHSPICVFIDSCGGDFMSTMVIHAILRASVAPVITFVTGRAHSGAFIIFQAGGKRKMAKGAELCFHWSTAIPEKDAELDEKVTVELLKHLRQENKALYRLVAKRTGLKMAAVKRFFADNRLFGPEEAKKYNLADEIIKKPVGRMPQLEQVLKAIKKKERRRNK